MANQLAHEISPYLLQHQDNPVHWLPWGEDAFALAKQQHKPVLVSIGYAACHWCHVMAHESFEDPAIADILNQHFICIKVDREERPDVDAIYMQALQLMQIPGGWPLNMFVTPDAKPFFGGTYFPSQSMYGRPGFAEVLEHIVKAWQHEQDKITEYTHSMQSALQRVAETTADTIPKLSELETACREILQLCDLQDGGLNGAPKFPQIAMWLNILNVAVHRHDQALLRAVEVTAEAMCQGGIYDHLGGGLARYATDSRWLVPHFEKMLYDNAQLLELLTRLWQVTHKPLYQERIIEIVNWLKREMLCDNGALASAIDADSEGEEGKYYIWDASEIDAILGEDSALFKRAYDVHDAGNWEGHSILHRRHAEILTATEEQRLPALREKLLAVRQGRIAPHRDDKVLADWNGLAIASLTRAAMVFARKDWLDVAVSIYQSVIQHLGKGKHLLHAYRAGQAKQNGLLDDYAAMIAAALSLYQANGNLNYLKQAEDWTEVVITEFSDPAGGFYTANQSAQDLIVRLKSIQDQATPSANGLMAYNLAQLYYLSGKAIYREQAMHILRGCAAELASSPMFYGSLVRALALLERASTVIIVGSDQSMLAAAWNSAKPDLLIIPVSEAAKLPHSHPAQAKVMMSGQTTAYICQNHTCGYPISDIETLILKLKES